MRVARDVQRRLKLVLSCKSFYFCQGDVSQYELGGLAGRTEVAKAAEKLIGTDDVAGDLRA
jgi:hypothetical protein